jgi:hypothetical protein
MGSETMTVSGPALLLIENGGNVDGQTTHLVTISPMDEQHEGMSERRGIEDSIKNEVLRTLSDRAARFLQVRETILVPDDPFAAPSVECALQFRDGHYSVIDPSCAGGCDPPCVADQG